MAQASAITSNFAKNGTDDCVGNYRRSRRLNASVMQISRGLFPLKTAHHLSEMTGYSVRAAERWLSEKTVLPADALASLIQSPQGREYLTAVMADTTPRWWLQLKAWIASIDYAAAEIKHRRKLRELLDDEATRQRSPAFLVQDEAFYEGQPSPVMPVDRRRQK